MTMTFTQHRATFHAITSHRRIEGTCTPTERAPQPGACQCRKLSAYPAKHASKVSAPNRRPPNMSKHLHRPMAAHSANKLNTVNSGTPSWWWNFRSVGNELAQNPRRKRAAKPDETRHTHRKIHNGRIRRGKKDKILMIRPCSHQQLKPHSQPCSFEHVRTGFNLNAYILAALAGASRLSTHSRRFEGPDDGAHCRGQQPSVNDKSQAQHTRKSQYQAKQRQ